MVMIDYAMDNYTEIIHCIAGLVGSKDQMPVRSHPHESTPSNVAQLLISHKTTSSSRVECLR